MEEYVFPIIAGESLLPLYLCSAGGTTSQPPVDRPAGFPVFHILYCTRGTGKLSAGGKETVIGTRQGFLLYPGVAHAYAALETPWETHWVTFDGHAAASTVRALGFDRSKVFCITDLPGLEKIWNALILRSKSGGVDRGYQCSAGIQFSDLPAQRRMRPAPRQPSGPAEIRPGSGVYRRPFSAPAQSGGALLAGGRFPPVSVPAVPAVPEHAAVCLYCQAADSGGKKAAAGSGFAAFRHCGKMRIPRPQLLLRRIPAVRAHDAAGIPAAAFQPPADESARSLKPPGGACFRQNPDHP